VLECGRVGVWGCWRVGVLECGRVGVWACWSVGVLECGRTVNCAQGLFVRERKRLFIARSLLDGLIRLCSCPPAPIAHTRRLRRCLCVCVCVSVCLCVCVSGLFQCVLRRTSDRTSVNNNTSGRT
jgi:hypothetical protein